MTCASLIRAFIFAVLFFSSSIAAAAEPDPQAELHAQMQRVRAEEGVTGIVWATIQNANQGQVITGAAGLKNAATGAALQPDDRVHIGSVTKTFIAAGVLRLATQGRLALDTPVLALVPDLNIQNPWADTDPVRVRHLLDHTAGLDDARLWQVFSLKPTPDTPLRDGLPEELTVRVRPGTRHSYSNTGYTVLGLVIEAVTGERYERYLDQNVLAPLGLRDSTFAFVTQGDDPRLAMGHFDDGTSHAAVASYVRPAMQFTTTAADMGRFALFLLGDGRIGDDQFIAADLMRAMGAPQDTEAAKAGLRVGYGLGLSTRDRNGAVGLCHGGNTVGYRAMLCLYPEAKRAFFIAANADSETARYGRFDQALVNALALPARSPDDTTGEAVDMAPWRGFYVPAPNRFAFADLIDRAFGFVRVDVNEGGVVLNPLQGAALQLTRSDGVLFRAPDRLIASHAFMTDGDGTRTFSTGLQTYAQVSWAALLPLWLGLTLGALAAIYIVVTGVASAVRRPKDLFVRPVGPTFIALAVLVFSGPLFLTQSFLAIGDRTPASIVLYVACVATLVAAMFGLWRWMRLRAARRAAAGEAVALICLLAAMALLASGGLWPIRLWA